MKKTIFTKLNQNCIKSTVVSEILLTYHYGKSKHQNQTITKGASVNVETNNPSPDPANPTVTSNINGISKRPNVHKHPKYDLCWQ
jgi:hypothetical protein